MPNTSKSIDISQENPQVLGTEMTERFGIDLPYLFKVLSVNKALSIQAHPDKKLAEKLFASRPDVYKDDNHKVRTSPPPHTHTQAFHYPP